MNCSDCGKAEVSRFAFESTMTRMERANRRLWIVVLALIVLLVGSNIAWLYYESQFETVETTTEIQQDTEGGGNNYVVGGNYNGYAENQNHDENANP